MREFVYGSDMQYGVLKDSLEDNLCHVYNCSFPPGCKPSRGRIGFEKENETYALFIDKGIQYSRSYAPSLFKEWLEQGTLRFLDFTDMVEYLRSLNSLY